MSENLSFRKNIRAYKKTKAEKYLEWYRLDNAATIYSLMKSKKDPNVFRVSCTLKKPIKLALMQQSLERLMSRLPYFNVTMRTGFFWKYWEQNPNTPKIEAETKYPNQYIPVHTKGTFPFRVKAYFNRIALEFHHSITDGTGAIHFLKALIADYLNQLGIEPSDWGDIKRVNQKPQYEEFEDAYKKIYKNELPKPKMKGSGYHPPYEKVKPGVLHLTIAKMSVKQLLKISREKKVTITDLLAAIYLFALQETLYNIPKKYRRRHMKPIRLAIPVNLRNIFPSKTMRNFSYMVAPELNPKLGEYSLDEILNLVHHSLRKEVSIKNLNQQISRNVKGELTPIVRTAPLFIKRLVSVFLYKTLGENMLSGKLSNIGKIDLPKEFADEIEGFDFILAASSTITTGCAVSSFRDDFVINFSRTIEEPVIERIFFRELVKLGIDVKIETN